jgi:hypothetical protein
MMPKVVRRPHPRGVRFGTQRCTRSVTVTGTHGFCIEQLDMEIAGPGQTDEDNQWQAAEFNIFDPGNLGIGDITYWLAPPPRPPARRRISR